MEFGRKQGDFNLQNAGLNDVARESLGHVYGSYSQECDIWSEDGQLIGRNDDKPWRGLCL